MTRRGIACAVAFLMAGLLVSPAKSFAYSRNFHIFNDTTRVFQSIWTSAYGDQYWHRVTGLEDLAPGQDRRIVFHRPGPCIIQLRVKIDGRNHDWRRGFNLCSIREITIYWNRRDHSYTARYR